jgi:predicted amidohydrolase
MKLSRFLCLAIVLSLAIHAQAADWTFWSPRDEVAPHHVARPNGVLVLETGEGRHWIGCWQQTQPVKGGQHYAFGAAVAQRGVTQLERSIVARVLWMDADGKPVRREQPAPSGYKQGETPVAEPEYPELIHGQRFAATIRAPAAAAQATIELYLQWTALSRAEFSDVKWEPVAAPAPRRVKLAAVHLQPRDGRSNEEKCRLFTPLIAQAAKQKVQLLVLPETLTYYSSGRSMAECAEPVPGASSQWFAQQAKEHGMHIVAGLIERDGPAIYNVAVLLGPQGQHVGKYRKVCLPRSEITAGVSPGFDYPVFDTPLGKVGMMVCYDGFFPEVANRLTRAGAELIAWPVWGCNPLLAAARSCENHVYVISSTYSDKDANWMRSGIWDPWGQLAATTDTWGSLAILEVDLNAHPYWNSLGDFKAQLPSHRPAE